MRLGDGCRSHWILDPSVAFLNNGSFGATPRVVLAEQQRWRDRMERQPVRFFMRDAMPGVRRAATALARFLGARPEHTVLVDNATSAIGAVLRSFEAGPHAWRRGDRVVTTSHVYGAVRQALRFVAGRTGATVVEVDLPFPLDEGPGVASGPGVALGPGGASGPAGVADALVARVDAALAAGARLLVVDHVTSATGLVLPLERLLAAASARGVPVLVDGAHAPGMLPLDLEHLGRLGATWYAGNAHKWLFAPKGTAFLWTRADAVDRTHPLVISHFAFTDFRDAFDWPGTRDLSGWLALPAAIRFAEVLDLDAMRAWHRQMTDRAAALWAERFGVEAGTPPDLRAALVTLPVVGADGRQIADPDTDRLLARAAALHDRLLARHGVEIPVLPFAGRLWTRVAGQVFVDEDWLERGVEAFATEAAGE